MAETYVVINKYHTRIGGPDGTHRYEVGDEIEPTEEELKAFPDRFRKQDQARAARRGPGRPPTPKEEREASEEESKSPTLPLPQGSTVTSPTPPRN